MSMSGKSTIRKDKVDIADVFKQREVKKAELAAEQEAVTEPAVKEEQEPVTEKAEKNKIKKEKPAKKTSLSELIDKKGHGVAKSVYFDDDNYTYIDKISKEAETKFSVILNLIIKEYRKEHEG